MAVYFCMAFVFLIALGAAVVAYAIFTAEEGCEDDRGYHAADLPPNFAKVSAQADPSKKSGFRLFNPEIPLPLFF